jgi:hypothetical protein
MNETIEQTLLAIKESIVFLLEQEKVRGEEVKALNDKIEAVNDVLVNQIINPAAEAYNEEQFNNFNDQYGERLGKYDQTIQSVQNNPEYSSSREAWNELQNLPEEERENVDMESFVTGVEEGLAEYVDGIKKSLGLPDDAPVEIKEEDGEIEVKADADGDGKMETVATEDSGEGTVDEGDGSEEEIVDDEEIENDEPTDEEMEKYLKGED